MTALILLFSIFYADIEKKKQYYHFLLAHFNFRASYFKNSLADFRDIYNSLAFLKL